ncbi:MAG TPA: type II toxin-antitoxin system RelE/ParE family toxin [Bryobacteraceae bacterium]|nr:type II toxin-antitoxin system RelE/ParE family toxin [Bryobacteraceae bacterium]
MKRYVVSPDARTDLDGIWDYIAERGSAESATDFVWKLYDTFTSIGSSPKAGVAAPSLLPGDTRKFPMGNYLIYYRPMRGKVLILRVLHGKRLQKKALQKRP